MSVEQVGIVCRRCDAHRMATRPGFPSLIHLLVTVFTCGVWIPFWIVCSIVYHFTPFRCTRCGTEAR